MNNDCPEVRVRELESLLKLSEARCTKLEYKLQDLLRRVFGPKNEKLNPAQRALFGIPGAGELTVLCSRPWRLVCPTPTRRSARKAVGVAPSHRTCRYVVK